MLIFQEALPGLKTPGAQHVESGQGSAFLSSVDNSTRPRLTPTLTGGLSICPSQSLHAGGEEAAKPQVATVPKDAGLVNELSHRGESPTDAGKTVLVECATKGAMC